MLIQGLSLPRDRQGLEGSPAGTGPALSRSMRRSHHPGIAAAAGRVSDRGPGEAFVGHRSRGLRGTGPAGAVDCKGEGSPAGRTEPGVDRIAAGRSLAAADILRVSIISQDRCVNMGVSSSPEYC